MVFFEALQHAIALDLGFFIELILGNLFWFFIFYSAIFYFFNGKRVLHFTIVFALLMWVWSDLQAISGLVWTSASFLLLYYITKLSTVAIVESVPRLGKFVVIISTLQFYVLFLAFNFLIR